MHDPISYFLGLAFVVFGVMVMMTVAGCSRPAERVTQAQSHVCTDRPVGSTESSACD